MSNYYRTSSDSGAQHQSDEQSGEDFVDRLARHRDELVAKIAEGWLVGYELVLRYEIDGQPQDVVVVNRQLGPPLETPQSFVDRYFEAAAEAVGDTPPS